MNENTIPALDQFAITDWSHDELQSLVNQEDGAAITNTQSAPTPIVEEKEVSQPAVQDNSYNDHLKEVLAEELEASRANELEAKTTLTEAQKAQLNTPSAQYVQQGGGNIFATAFEIMSELDLLRIPEGFDINQMTEEDLITFKEMTLEDQRQEAFDEIRQNLSHDPYMLNLLDYAYQGGVFADLPKMISLMQKEIDYRTLNLNDEVVQKEIVRRYLSNGLNPNNQKDMKLLEFIPEKINGLIKNKTLRNEAETARNYFLQIQEEIKRKEFERVLQVKEQERLYQERQILEQEQWNRDFINSLTKKDWTVEKKEAVKRENEILQMNDGSQIPVWQYKQALIFSNPDLFQYFLDFTSMFDFNSNQFKGMSAGKQKEQSTVNRLLQNMKNKNQNTMRANRNLSQGLVNKNSNPIADPEKDWF